MGPQWRTGKGTWGRKERRQRAQEDCHWRCLELNPTQEPLRDVGTYSALFPWVVRNPGCSSTNSHPQPLEVTPGASPAAPPAVQRKPPSRERLVRGASRQVQALPSAQQSTAKVSRGDGNRAATTCPQIEAHSPHSADGDRKAQRGKTGSRKSWN